MTKEEFAIGMKKLSDVFGGEKLYPQARVIAFYDELRGVEARLWSSVVLKLVKEESKPPMMREIRLALSSERERLREQEKFIERKESEIFFRSVNVPSEIKERFPHLFKSLEQK